MRRVRAMFRTSAFILSTIGWYSLWFVVQKYVIRTRYAALKWRGAIFRNWGKTAASIAHMHLTVEGTPPQPPFLLVTNHLGYMDVITLLTQLNCTFVAKDEIEHWPLLGFMGKDMEAIYIDRTTRKDISRVITLIDQALQENKGIVVFAEGTSSQGADVLPFLPSLLEPAARMHLPVWYASISYRTPPGEMPAHLSVCWWGDMRFKSHLVNLFRLPYFEAILTFGPEPLCEPHRKTLARKLHAAIKEQFHPVVILEEKDHAP